MKQLSKSAHYAALNTHAALSILEKNGGEMRYLDICKAMEQTRDFTEWERETTKSGHPRWRMYLGFFSIEIAKVGYIIRNKGVWHLTEEGQEALKQSPEDFFTSFHSAYKELCKAQKPDADNVEETSEEMNEIEDLQGRAIQGIIDYIIQKTPYEFQDLVAALLRAMGYYTPFIAPKGKDGGIDIIAYRDPLGTNPPTLKVQVKHYPSSVISVEIIRSLIGVLIKEDECGLIVTSGKFTSDAIHEARQSHRRIRLIDIDEFLTLWEMYYDKMPQEDKNLLPLMPIYFLKPFEL